MDGIEELNGVTLLAATNRPDAIVSGGYCSDVTLQLTRICDRTLR